MATEQSVYSFELHFLNAVKDILQVDGVQTLVFGDEHVKEGPRIEAGISVSNADTVQRHLINRAAVQYLGRYNGNLSVQIFTQDTTETHFLLVGLVRSKLSYILPSLNSISIPFYQVKGLYEQTSQNGLSSERDDEIVTSLNFSLEWSIPRESFSVEDPFLTYNGMQLVYNGIPLTYNFEPLN